MCILFPLKTAADSVRCQAQYDSLPALFQIVKE
jgi:hypothetical protein